jgi:hypothetical protein
MNNLCKRSMNSTYSKIGGALIPRDTKKREGWVGQ